MLGLDDLFWLTFGMAMCGDGEAAEMLGLEVRRAGLPDRVVLGM